MRIITGIQKSPQKVVLYGPEGIGKSTFASHFPNPLFIDTEGSTKHLNVNRTEPPQSWDLLMEQVKYVSEHPGICQTLIIDTVDWAEELCARFVCRKAEKTSIEQFGYGKGYTYLAEEFRLLIGLLDNIIKSGIHVVLLAHATLRKFELPDEMGAFDKWEMKLTKKVSPMVKEWADMLLFANFQTFVVKDKNGKGKAQGGQRIMFTSHTPTHDAKNRCGLEPEVPFDFGSIEKVILENTVDTASEMEKALKEPSEGNPFEDDDEIPFDEDFKKLPDDIPEQLAVLMTANNVTEDEIRQAVSYKGYYDKKLAIKNYDEEFINGVLIGAWNQVFELIKANRR